MLFVYRSISLLMMKIILGSSVIDVKLGCTLTVSHSGLTLTLLTEMKPHSFVMNVLN